MPPKKKTGKSANSPRASDDSDALELPLEEAMAKLERIAAELEEGQLGLTQSLARYEEGVALLRQCHLALKNAEQKVELLTSVDADGNAVTTAFRKTEE